MSKKDTTRIAALETSLQIERAKRTAAEAVIDAHDQAQREAAAAPPPPPAPAAPPPDPALVHYRALKASKNPGDNVLAGQLLRDNPHVLDLLEAERRGGT